MRFLRLAVTVVLTTVIAPVHAALPSSSPEDAGLSAARLTRITELLQASVDAGQIAGAVAAVARHGKLAYLQNIGWQDIEQQQAMQTDSIFQISTLSTPVTAVAALQLIEQGKMGLQDPVSAYIPRFAYLFVLINPDEPFLSAERKPARPMTIEDLLLNTAGLSQQGSPLYLQRRVLSRGDNLDQLVNKVAGVPLVGDPGAQWLSGIAPTVLGRIVEIVSGQSLDDYLSQYVFNPLQMNDTGFFVPEDSLDRLTQIYSASANAAGLIPETAMDVPITQDPPLLEGGAGLVSTVPDYLGFMQALLNQGVLESSRILADETVIAMTSNRLPNQLLPISLGPEQLLPGQGWGYGVGVVVDEASSNYAVNNGEFGWSGSLGTYAWADPQTGTVAILMIQIRSASADNIAISFKDLVYSSILE